MGKVEHPRCRRRSIDLLTGSAWCGYDRGVSSIDAPTAHQYFEQCLIKPPTFPGTLKPEDYLLEISYEFVGGTRDLIEVSEIVGEIVGAEMVKVVIAQCIWAAIDEECSPRDSRKAEKALEKVVSNSNRIMKSWSYQLDMERVAVGAARNLNYLIGAGKPKVTLQNEMNLGSDFSDLRYKCVREYSPVRLRELLFDRIVEVTGYRPVQ